MLDSAGHVAEASGMNLFVVKEDLLYTPAVYVRDPQGRDSGRGHRDCAEAGTAWSRPILNRYDLYTADEAFFTGTAAEIAPIRIGGWAHRRNGKAGPVTRDLMARFRQYTRA